MLPYSTLYIIHLSSLKDECHRPQPNISKYCVNLNIIFIQQYTYFIILCYYHHSRTNSLLQFKQNKISNHRHLELKPIKSSQNCYQFMEECACASHLVSVADIAVKMREKYFKILLFVLIGCPMSMSIQHFTPSR